jgi:hypothetical protein
MDPLDFIKEKYPQVIIKTIDLSKYKDTNALGFIISDDKVIVGYITKEGTLKKILNPMDISDFDINLIKDKIPRVYSTSLTNLNTLIDNAKKSTKKKIDEKIFKEETVPLVLYSELEKKYLLVKKEHEAEILEILADYKKINENKQMCINKLNSEKDVIQSKIKNYINDIKKQLLDKEKTTKETNELWQKVISERDLLSQRLLLIGENDSNLQKTIDTLTDSFHESEFKNKFLQESFDKCKETMINEKSQIILKIKEYKLAIKNYISNIDYKNKEKLNSVKKQMLQEFNQVKMTLDKITDDSGKELKSCKDINIHLNDTLTKNLIRLNNQEDYVYKCEKRAEKLQMEIQKKDLQINELNVLLDETKQMIKTSNASIIIDKFDYTKCQNTLYTFVSLNNIFVQKLDIIKKIQTIIDKKQNVSQEIQIRFNNVSKDIVKQIDFLDLQRYINSIYLDFFKNENTITKIPESFCQELNNLIIYWNDNIEKFKAQDYALTNIFEDLSSAVRVYIRIKPDFSDNKSIFTIENENSLVVNCKRIKPITFNSFYGIFDETKTNFDIYTGTNLPQKNDYKVDIPTDNLNYTGLYNVFNQLQEGYNILMLGYGISGSGKSHSLFGSNSIMGLTHFGLGNLKNVSDISIVNVFEQYNRLVNINFNQMTGQIINLIGTIHELEKFSKNEHIDLDTHNINLDKLENIINTIDSYRREKKRIRKTPNNMESSRSTLYMVFKITFNNGIIGHFTVIDTAGRESPIEIYKKFLDTTKVSLPSILSLSDNKELIYSALKPNYKDYASTDVYNLLKESFYINESLNHLVYYLNYKNGIDSPVYPQSSSLNKYDTSKYYISPKTEMKSIKEANNCLTIPIMQFLEKSHKIDKPTKFILMANVRKELEYCDSTIATLQFVSKIKSS